MWLPQQRKASSTPTYNVRVQSGNIRGLSTYCTQTNYLYADSVCLPARMESSRQSVQIWTCPRTLISMRSSFVCRTGAVNMWSNQRVLTFVEDLHFHARLWDMQVQITKTVIKGRYDWFSCKKYNGSINEVGKRFNNLKGQIQREQKKAVTSKKRVSSPKKSTSFAYKVAVPSMKKEMTHVH